MRLMSFCPGKAHNGAALRPWRKQGIHPEAGGGYAGHIPELYFQIGKAYHKGIEKRNEPDAVIKKKSCRKAGTFSVRVEQYF